VLLQNGTSQIEILMLREEAGVMLHIHCLSCGSAKRGISKLNSDKAEGYKQQTEVVALRE
jgi:hypothetical protein